MLNFVKGKNILDFTKNSLIGRFPYYVRGRIKSLRWQHTVCGPLDVDLCYIIIINLLDSSNRKMFFKTSEGFSYRFVLESKGFDGLSYQNEIHCSVAHFSCHCNKEERDMECNR